MTAQEQPIVDAIAHDDYRTALELTAKLYAKAIGRYCKVAAGSGVDSDELLQEILLAAHHAMSAFEGRASVKTWLFSIARRHVSRALQRSARQGAQLTALDQQTEHGNPDHAPDAQLAAARRKEQLSRALAQLTERQRDVIVLRYVGELGYRQIADVCGIAEDAARQRAASGLRALRRLMSASNQPRLLQLGENTP